MTKSIFDPSPYPDPPSGLSEQSQNRWRTFGPQYAKEPGRQALLLKALELWDLDQACGRQVAADGLALTTKTTGAAHVHPLLPIQLKARQQYIAILMHLGFAKEQGMFGDLG
jgi:phage terminase small subunit